MNVGPYPSAHVAARHSILLLPVQVVQFSTDGSESKSSQQKPPGMNETKPSAHVAVVQSVASSPTHTVQLSTDASSPNPWQHRLSAAMNVPYPAAHVAEMQSETFGPVQLAHESTEAASNASSHATQPPVASMRLNPVEGLQQAHVSLPTVVVAFAIRLETTGQAS
jgi:hypothetical protein